VDEIEDFSKIISHADFFIFRRFRGNFGFANGVPAHPQVTGTWIFRKRSTSESFLNCILSYRCRDVLYRQRPCRSISVTFAHGKPHTTRKLCGAVNRGQLRGRSETRTVTIGQVDGRSENCTVAEGKFEVSAISARFRRRKAGASAPRDM
jgi:hypothetical protein